MTTYIEPMKHYEADVSVRRVGIITAPKIPPDHPSVRFSSCLHREVFPACDITEARQHAIAFVENPSTPSRKSPDTVTVWGASDEFLKCLDFYFVPFKTLQWEDWQDPIESVGKVSPQPTGYGEHLFPPTSPEGETQIHSCASHPFLVGVYKWIVKILVYEVSESVPTR